MSRRNYNIELLLDTLKRDEASLEGEYPILMGKTIITLKCKCGDITTRKFTDIIVSSGAFCRKCIISHSREMAKKTCKEKYGVENPSQCDKIKDKKTKTTMEHYGVENPFQADEIKEQSKATNIIKYGVENPLQSEEIKEKFKHTLLERYGVEHPSQIDDIKDKKKQTSLEKYGVEHTLQVKEFREKGKETMVALYGVENAGQSSEIMEKVKNTMIERYGVENPSQSKDIVEKKRDNHVIKYGVEYPGQRTDVKEKAKATNLIKYGVENAAQSKEVQEKTQKNAKKYKEFGMPSGAIRKVQGYEPFALEALLKAGYTEEQILTERKDVPYIDYEVDGKKRRYFPDIFIPHEHKIIEVKSTWTYACKTDNIELKKKACLDAGYLYETWCYDSKGVRVEV